MPFCSNCGTESEANERFCRHCGASLAASVAGRQTVEPAPVPETAVRVLPNYLSPTRILVMAVLSYGLYLFYWFYLTWKQYRDHTGEDAFPVWHALTLLVPIYGFFRTHAHVRTFKELMKNSGVASTLSPGWAVGLVALTGLLDGISFNVSGGFISLQEISRGTSLAVALLDALSITVVVGLLLQLQGNLNRYWGGLPEVMSGEVSLKSARIGAGEIILLVLGLLAWFNTLMLLFSPEYRAGSFGA